MTVDADIQENQQKLSYAMKIPVQHGKNFLGAG
jgi:hypothetical protein